MYLSWNEQTISDFSEANIESMYHQGYVFTRIDKGIMEQTRSLRIDLNKFELSSENKRILKKTEDLQLAISPIPYADYTWEIHKIGKDFYEQKFGPKTFSAQKIKELMTDAEKSNFNRVFVYSLSTVIPATAGIQSLDHGFPIKSGMTTDNSLLAKTSFGEANRQAASGYCIALETKNITHYCYPFYNLEMNYPNMGMGMMLKAIVWAKDQGKQYIYLGSAQRPTDTYKLQFAGLEWFDGVAWQTNTEELKTILQNLPSQN